MEALVEAHYLPCIEYFCMLLDKDKIWLEQYEHFNKQTYRNRCYIRGANRVQDLRIPVRKGKSKTLIRDLTVDPDQAWQKNHWRSIVSAYGKAPFFEHYADELERVFRQKDRFLMDYTLPLLTLCLQWLEMPVDIELTSTYVHPGESSIPDLRNQILPKEVYAGRPFYQPVAYPQVFGKDFAENLSIIDLIACEGPNARSVLNSSRKA